MVTRLLMTMVALAVAAGTARPALAAPLDEAKAEFAAGKEAFERGDYEIALQHYQRANQLVPAASLQYNIGNCYEHLGRPGPAAAAFEKYLEMTGPPTNDDDKDFQEKLRARISADKKRAAEATPQQVPQQPLPQPVYTPPTYYVPPVPPPPPREYRLQMAKARRTRAIALMAVGLSLSAIGIGVFGDGMLSPHCTYGYIGNPCNIAEAFFGATFFVVGTTLWAPGAASYVGAQRQIAEINKEAAGGAPHAFLFHSPAIKF
jgi:tetratricopeptide (TPR) repeat protein